MESILKKSNTSRNALFSLEIEINDKTIEVDIYDTEFEYLVDSLIKKH